MADGDQGFEEFGEVGFVSTAELPCKCSIGIPWNHAFQFYNGTDTLI